MNLITEENIEVHSIFDDYSLEFKIIALETFNSSLYTDSNENAHRTILAFDNEIDVEEVSNYLIKNSQSIHLSFGNIEKIQAFIPHTYVHMAAYTNLYWSDVKYCVSERRTDIVDDVHIANNLSIKMIETVKDIFYDRDVLASICLNKNYHSRDVKQAIDILHKGKINIDIVKDLFSHNKDVEHEYQKILLNENLLTQLDSKHNANKKKI